MTTLLAHLVAQANISRLSLIGLAKNVGKTTATNHLLETLLSENLYRAEELALTSLGLDGETTDALTGLSKPRYLPQAGVIVATTTNLLHQAESDGAQVEYLAQLPGRTALGPVVLARVLHPGRMIIAGPTLLRDLRSALHQMEERGTRLAIIDGAINRLGAASPAVTDACIVCTGASAGTTPAIVAHRTVDVLARLSVPQTRWTDVYKSIFARISQRQPDVRLLTFSIDYPDEVPDNFFSLSAALADPLAEAEWMIEQLQTMHQKTIFLLRGAFTGELSRELLTRLAQQKFDRQAELVVGDATKIFCHSVTIQRLAAKGLHLRVADPIRVLAVSMNPYTPEYSCSARQLLDALLKELPVEHPPIIDVVSGLSHNGTTLMEI